MLVAWIHAVAVWILGIIKVSRCSDLSVLALNHMSTSPILKVTLLLVCLDGDISIYAVVVLFLFCKHFVKLLFIVFILSQ